MLPSLTFVRSTASLVACYRITLISDITLICEQYPFNAFSFAATLFSQDLVSVILPHLML